MEPVQLATILAGAVLVASMVSVEVGVSVALIELALGIALGNIFSLDPDQSWLVFIASFAGVVLTFLAGAEVDPDDFRERFWVSVGMGVASFVGPFVVATLVAIGPLGWSTKASLIAGTALSTTGLAVVYAVLVETGLNSVRVGKLIMSACFVTDMCTVIALSVIFLKPTVWFPVFAVVSIVLIVALPKIAPWFFGRYGDRVIKPEIKLMFLVLFVLMVLGEKANSQAVLPAFVVGLVMSRHYQQHRQEQQRLRVVAFAFLTPFFFLRGGMNVSLGAVFANLGLLAVLAAAKLHPEVRPRLPDRPPLCARARHVHDLADEHRADVRDDQLALRTASAHHQPHPVLAADHRRRARSDRPDRGRAALVQPQPGRGARRRRARRVQTTQPCSQAGARPEGSEIRTSRTPSAPTSSLGSTDPRRPPRRSTAPSRSAEPSTRSSPCWSSREGSPPAPAARPSARSTRSNTRRTSSSNGSSPTPSRRPLSAA